MSALIISFDQKKVDKVCSFCKTPESKAKHFFVSNTSSHCICDKCIEKSTQLIKESK